MRERHSEIDLLRTIAILGMVVYHGAYDLWLFYEWNLDPFAGGWKWLQLIVANLFLGLVGVSFAISAQNKTRQQIWQRSWQRAGLVLGCAMIVSLVTYLIDEHTFVRFGVLHCIGFSLLLLPLFRHGKEWNVLIGLLWLLATGWIEQIDSQSMLLLPLGVLPADFFTVDYYPLFPWFGVILIGYGIGYFLYARTKLNVILRAGHSRSEGWSSSKDHSSFNIHHSTTWPGRHSLLIYMLHQPVIIGLLWLVNTFTHIL